MTVPSARRRGMPRHVVLARVAGVPVGVTPPLVLAVLVLVGAAGVGWAPLALGVGGLTAVVSGSVLVHELGHGLVARAHGFEVEGVVLGLAGGVVAYEGEPPSPAVEIRIAAAGPFASAVLACAAVLVHPATGGAGAVSDLVLAAAWVNLANAVVNLLPLPTLDGARIAGALLRRRSEGRPARVEVLPRPAPSLEP